MADPSENIFEKLSDRPEAEVIDILMDSGAVRIERIVSNGQPTPEGEWYDQDRDEWVVLLRGGACIRFEDPKEEIELLPGDFLNIAAHRRHRVEWTRADEPTLWLAVHYAS